MLHPRIVFIVDKPASHIFASMGLARRLQRLGYRPEYWGDAQIGPTVQGQGFPFRRLDGLWSRYQDAIRLPTNCRAVSLLRDPLFVLRNVAARRRVQAALPEALDRFAASLDALCHDYPPALAVFDPFLLAYFPFFRARGIPVVTLSTKPVPVADPIVPPYSSLLIPSRSRVGRWRTRAAWLHTQLADVANRAAAALVHGCGAYTHERLVVEASRRNAVCAASDQVRRWVHPDLHFRSVDEWALWTQQMDLPRERPLPPNVRYVGPSVDLDRREAELPLRRDLTSRIIYVAVGTVRFRWRDNVPFLRKVVAAFAEERELLVAISTGDPRATAAVGVTPAHIQVFDFLPQLKMLEVADLVITHAGAGTLRECIAKEVPMLAYPSFHDQMGNSARIVVRGLGYRGVRGEDTPAQIRAKALELLHDDTVRRNLRMLRADIEHREGDLLRRAFEAVLPPSVTRETTLGGIAPSKPARVAGSLRLTGV